MIQKLEHNQIVLAGGCFWCIEAALGRHPGVTKTMSGYANADKDNPTYMDVAYHRVQAREAVLLTYDPDLTNFSELVQYFFTQIDPTDTGGQFADRGFSYTTAIYTQNETEAAQAKAIIDELEQSKKYPQPIATIIEPFVNFTPAEEYHQNYADKNPLHYQAYYAGSGRKAYVQEQKNKK